MDTTTVIVILVIVIGLVIAYVSWLFEQKRREAYRTWAELNGWSYDHRRNRQTYHRYSNFNRLQRGSNRYAFDILQGTWNKYPASAFNFHYETYSTSSDGKTTTRKTHHHYFGVVLIQIERFFPKLLISPNNIFKKIGDALGFGGINFESVEFSERFTVRCHNKKFAYDFCHPRMMEYLLTRPDTVIELEGNIFALFNGRGKMNPDQVEESLNKLIQLRELIPKYLFRN